MQPASPPYIHRDGVMRLARIQHRNTHFPGLNPTWMDVCYREFFKSQ